MNTTKTTTDRPQTAPEAPPQEMDGGWNSIDYVFPTVVVAEGAPRVSIGDQPVVVGKNIVTDPQWRIRGNRATIRVSVDGEEAELSLVWKGRYDLPVPDGYEVWPRNKTEITHQFFLAGFEIHVFEDGAIHGEGEYCGLGDAGSLRSYAVPDQPCVKCYNPPNEPYTVCGVEAGC